MAKSFDAEFEKIAKETIKAAEKVKCPKEDFIEGLRAVRDAVAERLSLED